MILFIKRICRYSKRFYHFHATSSTTNYITSEIIRFLHWLYVDVPNSWHESWALNFENDHILIQLMLLITHSPLAVSFTRDHIFYLLTIDTPFSLFSFGCITCSLVYILTSYNWYSFFSFTFECITCSRPYILPFYNWYSLILIGLWLYRLLATVYSFSL